MGIFEKFEKKEREAGQPSTTEREIKGPALKEILANKEQSDLFAEYLNEEGEGDLARELMSGSLERGMLERLAERRKEFLAIMEQSKNISEALDGKAIEELMVSSPELQKIGELVGPDGIRNALRRHLPRIAIIDRDRFERLDHGISVIRNVRKSIAEEEKEIEKLRKQYKISEDQYVELLRGGDAEEIAEEVHSRIGWFRRKFKKVSTIQEEIESLAGESAEKLRSYMETNRQDMKELGGILELTLIDNPLLHETIVGELRKEQVEKQSPGASFSEVRENIDPNEADVKKGWEEYRSQHSTYEDLDDSRKLAEAMTNFSQDYTRKMKRGKKGFWASIWGDVFSAQVEAMLKKN